MRRRKLRPDTSVTGIGQPVIALFLFGIVWLLSGITIALVFIAIVYGAYALLSLLFLIRTGNPWFIATLVFQLTILVYALIAPEIGIQAVDKETFRPLTLLLIVEFAVLAYILATGKLKWKGSEVLELAAQDISDVSDGFTDRPRPAGKIEQNDTMLKEFTVFLKKNLIATSVVDEQQTIILPVKMGEEYKLQLGFSTDYMTRTRIMVGQDGTVSAVISKKDYLNYKEAYSFDQLTQSLGQLLIRFYDYFRNGEEIRIIHEIKRASTGPFS